MRNGNLHDSHNQGLVMCTVRKSNGAATLFWAAGRFPGDTFLVPAFIGYSECLGVGTI